MQRYNFEKTRPYRNTISAEGIAVHAESLQEAEEKAKEILQSGENLKGFRDNRRCATTCFYCDS